MTEPWTSVLTQLLQRSMTENVRAQVKNVSVRTAINTASAIVRFLLLTYLNRKKVYNKMYSVWNVTDVAVDCQVFHTTRL